MPVRVPDADPDPLRVLGESFLAMSSTQADGIQKHLKPAERYLIERAIAHVGGVGWRASPLTMGQHFGELEDLPHTRLLSDKFADAVEGRSSYQIWNLPPQHGKSLVASRHGPRWALDMDPSIGLALTSYGDQLAQENARWVRDSLILHGDELAARLRHDVRRGDRFLTRQGGGMIAAGVGSTLTGFGAHGVIVDDPFKNWQEAHSPARRAEVRNWFLTVVRTRLNHRRGIPGFIIVCMTRWHEEDLTGWLLEQQQLGVGFDWEHVNLPALAEENDPLGRPVGAALAPLLHPVEELQQLSVIFGSYLFAGLYQQRPAPEEGGELKRDWWEWYDEAPPQFDDALSSWDMKMKDKTGGDFVVGQAWGRTGSDMWLLDSLRGQWNFATTKAAIALMVVRHPNIATHVIENAGNGPEVMQELREPQPGYTVSEDIRSTLGIIDAEVPLVNAVFQRGIPGLVPNNVKGDKVARARAESGLVEAGNCHLPRGRAFATAFVDEAAAFPAGAHDDQVDAWSQAMKRLRVGSTTVVTSPSGRIVGKPNPAARSAAGRTVGRPRMR